MVWGLASAANFIGYRFVVFTRGSAGGQSMMGDQGLIAVTGASGYIGKVFTRLAEAQGHQIAKLGRQTQGFASWTLEAEDVKLPAQPLKAVSASRLRLDGS